MHPQWVLKILVGDQIVKGGLPLGIFGVVGAFMMGIFFSFATGSSI